MQIKQEIQPQHLRNKLNAFWSVSGQKIRMIEQRFDPKEGAPVFTVKGKYTTRGWTDWTQGFQFGSAILQYEASREPYFLETGRQATLNHMAHHLTHVGVHDHGFNNLSTYGNLWRLMQEGAIPENPWEKAFYELAIKVSGAVQASRWTPIKEGGFIYSFNGPHSLFVDTIRSLRILVMSHEFGHMLKGENDRSIDLLHRAVDHALCTAKHSIYYGDGRDQFDEWGRTAHESIFNVNDGNYRAPNSQQGYSGFTTWTRGLAWAILGFAEQLEYLNEKSFSDQIKPDHIAIFEKAAKATADFYIKNTPSNGIPYWDTGDPNLSRLHHVLNKEADPFNGEVPVDSSAAVITAQGLLRLGHYFKKLDRHLGERYFQAGLTIADSLFDQPYLSNSEDHEGLILHAVYHYPNDWDYRPDHSKVPYGEATMWGDYHARELAIYLGRLVDYKPYHTFFNGIKRPNT